MPQRNPVALLLLAAALVGVPTLGPAPASAQGWSAENTEQRRAEIIRRYREILERRPEEGRIFELLLTEVGGGAALDALADDYAARAEADPTDFGALMLLGHLRKRSDRLEDARAAYEAARELRPDDVLPWRSLGGVYARLELRAESEEAWERALALATDVDAQREILRELADIALAAREWERAGEYFDRLVALEPDNVYVRMELAETLVRFERYDDALAQYQAIADAAGTDTRQRAVATRDIGEVQMLMGLTDEAVETYRRAMRMVEPGYWLYRELQLRIVEVYRRADRLDEYVAELEQAQRSPSYEDLMLLASLYDELGRDDDAIEALWGAVRRNRGSVDARLALIRVLERRGETDAVIDEYRTLIRDNPGDAGFRFRLVDVLRRSGDRDGATATLEDVADRFVSDPNVLLEVADRYMRFRLPDEAGPLYERLVRIDPNEPDYRVALGEWHFLEGRRSEAERVWRELLRIIEPEADARAALGDVLADHGLTEEAILEYEEAVAAVPDSEPYRRSLARLYGEAGRMQQSLRLWTALLDESDQVQIRNEARAALVRGWESLGRLQDRIPEWRAEWEADPGEIDRAYLVAEASQHLGDEDAAEAAWQAILAADATDVNALVGLERLYTAQGRISDSIAMLTRITEVAPGRAREALHRLAELSLRIFDDEAAVGFAQAAVALNPDDASAQARLGDVYRQMQRYDEAVAAYREAIDLDPRAFPVYFQLADVYQTMQRPAEANALYREVLESTRDEVQVLRAGRRALRIDQAAGTLDEFVAVVDERLYEPTVGTAFLKLAIEATDAQAQPLARLAAAGSEGDQAAARDALDAIGRRSQRALLDAVVGDDVALRAAALRLLPVVRPPGAALAVARLVDAVGIAPDQQRDALAVLATLADPRATAALLRALRGSDEQAAALAAWGLARAGATDSAAELAAVASDRSRSATVRAAALVAAARSTSEPVQSAVVDALQAGLLDESGLVRRAALLGVGLARVDALGDAVSLALEHGQVADAVHACWALSLLPSSPARRAILLDAWLQAPGEVSAAALDAVRYAGRTGVASARLAAWETVQGYWNPSAGTFDAERWLSGIAAVGRVEPDAGAAPEPGEIEAAGERAMGAGRQPTAVVLDRLVAATRGAHDGLATSATTALASFVPAAERTLASSADPRARRAAVGLIVAADAASASVGALLAAARDDADAVVRDDALEALGRAGHAELGTLIAEASGSASWRTRRAAAVAAGWSADPAHRDPVVALRDDPMGTVRGRAAWALLRIDGDAACGGAADVFAALPAAARAELLLDASALSADCRAAIRDAASVDPDARVRALGARLR